MLAVTTSLFLPEPRCPSQDGTDKENELNRLSSIWTWVVGVRYFVINATLKKSSHYNDFGTDAWSHERRFFLAVWRTLLQMKSAGLWCNKRSHILCLQIREGGRDVMCVVSQPFISSAGHKAWIQGQADGCAAGALLNDSAIPQQGYKAFFVCHRCLPAKNAWMAMPALHVCMAICMSAQSLPNGSCRSCSNIDSQLRCQLLLSCFMSDLRQIDFKSWRKINPIEDWMENEQGKKKKVADSIIPPPTPNMSGSVLKKKKEMFAEKLFWLSWFYSKVLISSIVCVFFRASCQSCRHPQPWMASFIVRMSWPGRLCCWVWLLCDRLKFLNTLHKIFYCLIQASKCLSYCQLTPYTALFLVSHVNVLC